MSVCLCVLVLPILPLHVRSIVTHGFVLDGGGAKMSKSLGNVVSPDDIITKEVCKGVPTALTFV